MMKKIENFFCCYYFYKKGKLNESKVQKGILFNLFSLLRIIPIKKKIKCYIYKMENYYEISSELAKQKENENEKQLLYSWIKCLYYKIFKLYEKLNEGQKLIKKISLVYYYYGMSLYNNGLYQLALKILSQISLNNENYSSLGGNKIENLKIVIEDIKKKLQEENILIEHNDSRTFINDFNNLPSIYLKESWAIPSNEKNKAVPEKLLIKVLFLYHYDIIKSKGYLLSPKYIEIPKNVSILEIKSILSEIYKTFIDVDVDIEESFYYKLSSGLPKKEKKSILFLLILFISYDQMFKIKEGIIDKMWDGIEPNANHGLTNNDVIIVEIKGKEHIIKWIDIMQQDGYKDFCEANNCHICNMITFNYEYLIPFFTKLSAHQNFHKYMFEYLIKNHSFYLTFYKPQYSTLTIKKAIKNLGNSCYMNAGLQCLIHCNYLTLYFLNTYHKFEEIKSQSKIVQEYVKFLNLYSNDSSASVNPQELISLFLNEMTDYQKNEQNDSSVFISDFLTLLNSGLNRNQNKNNIIYSDGSSSQKYFRRFLKKSNSVITDLFFGQNKIEWNCECFIEKSNTKTCHCKENVTFDRFLLYKISLSHLIQFIEIDYIYLNQKSERKQFQYKDSIENLAEINKDINNSEYMVVEYDKNKNEFRIMSDKDLLTFEIQEKKNSILMYEIEKPTIMTNQKDANIKKNINFLIILTVIDDTSKWLKKSTNIYSYIKPPTELNQLKYYHYPLYFFFNECINLNELTESIINKINELINNGTIRIHLSKDIKFSKLKTYQPESICYLFHDKINILYFNLKDFINQEENIPITFNLFQIKKVQNYKEEAKAIELSSCLNNSMFRIYENKKCECGKSKYFHQTITILPFYFLIHLDRVEIINGQFIKNRTGVEYPEQLNLYNYVDHSLYKKNDCNYKLICVNIHNGNSSTGHYKANCSVKDKWFQFNDRSVKEINKCQSKSAVVLFYEKCYNENFQL